MYLRLRSRLSFCACLHFQTRQGYPATRESTLPTDVGPNESMVHLFTEKIQSSTIIHVHRYRQYNYCTQSNSQYSGQRDFCVQLQIFLIDMPYLSIFKSRMKINLVLQPVERFEVIKIIIF